MPVAYRRWRGVTVAIWRIAVGVFIGNLLFAVLAWLLFGMAMSSFRGSLAAPIPATAQMQADDREAARLEDQADQLEALANATR